MILRPLDTTDDAPDVLDPSFWGDVAVWLGKAGVNLIQVALIIVGAVLAAWILRLVIRRVVTRIVRGAKSKAQVTDTQALESSPLSAMRLVQRTRTLGSILQNIVNVSLVVIALLLVVQTIAPNALGSFTLLTAAVGAGLGFGAQNIVRDVLNGIFLVAEDQVGIGDVVDLDLASGVVEYVSVRITHVRDVNGTLWYVRNGEITRVGNMSQGWSRAIIDLTVPVDADIDDVEQVMLDTARGLAHDAKWRSRILEDPEVWGLESITGDALVMRLVIKTLAGSKDDVAGELRVRLKRAFDEMGVGSAQMSSVMLTGLEGAQRVRGANPPRTRPTPVPPPSGKGIWKAKKRPGRDADTRATPDDDAPAEGDDE
ncbi:mechanosensitive ion channel family protein [Microbacterium sp. No. 7]|uniref:mechanosensitive ion channel family protein n=1 Tax=Microbacterium sp. No. 7 TaxID=1714373 RepID=UPI0006D0D959|nr:mechanosensitive ion channel domain-containing protein [Microbacterium sp. No. 7]ALJ20265.1 mechanosensitive ion channel protein MscS [Microbacterium sp. No. 7]